MTYQEVLDNAREKILRCKACPECNGLACGNVMPGPGSKAPGNGAYDNWRAWREIKLDVDTFAADGPVDTSMALFGRRFSLPLMTGPIGTLLQYSKEDVTVPYNDDIMHMAADCGIIGCFGDGLVPQTNPEAAASIGRWHAAGIPVFNPLPNPAILKRMELMESSEALAVCVVVDSAGIRHMKFPEGSPAAKTVEELKELKSATKKPFIIKGIMTARAAEKAVAAGADAIMVSNHGGRVQADQPATAQVLPEIAAAVGGQTKIIVDGGIRSGSDMLKALALGADAVLICRPYITAWFGGGTEALKVYTEKLRGEFTDAMYMCGARSLADIDRHMIRYIR